MKIILIIFGVFIVLFVSVYAYYGGFSKVYVKVENQGGEVVVYENVTGDYKQTPKVSDKIYYSLLNDEQIETTRGIGIFYDNPRKVEKDKLRSEVGCIVENADSTMIARLSDKYQIKTLRKGDYIVAEFPFKGTMSILMGIMKVYPALSTYCEKNGYKESPVIEIYDVPNGKIIYWKEAMK